MGTRSSHRAPRRWGRAALAASGALLASTASAQPPEPVDPPLAPVHVERMLGRLTAESSGIQGLTLREYVVVVGRAPELSVPAAAAVNPEAVQYGAPTHTEMMAAARPLDLPPAGASLIPLPPVDPAALWSSVASWFGGGGDDSADEGPRFAAYTGVIRLARGPGDPTGGTSSVPFYRTDGQPVAMSLQLPRETSARVRVTVDDRELGVFGASVEDLEVPADLMTSEDLHTARFVLTDGTGDVVGEAVELQVVVVVYAGEV